MPKAIELTEHQQQIIASLLPIKTIAYISIEAQCSEYLVRKYAKKIETQLQNKIESQCKKIFKLE